MDFGVLGSLRLAGADGSEIRLHSAAQRRLASILVLWANRVAPAEYLSSELALSSGALRTSISRLRRLVGPETLVTRPPGYELRPVAVDAAAFEGLVVQARAGRDLHEARSLLEAALAMWRGEAYAEFAHEPWAMAESRRLAELRVGALEDLVATLAQLGEWSASLAIVGPLITAHPFRDRARALLMSALAASGRRADALRAFQEYRRLLLDELGIEPSTDIVALDRAIASHTSTPPAPVPLPTKPPPAGEPVAIGRPDDDAAAAAARYYEVMGRTSADGYQPGSL